MILILLLLARDHLPHGLCLPTTSAGWVATIERRGDSPAAVPSVVTRDGASGPLMTSQLLCEGDVVRNPPRSNVVLHLRLSGRLVKLAPGDPPFRVGAPGWMAWAGNLARSINDAFSAYRGSREALSTAGVRGGETSCIVSPTSHGRADNYVLAEVPIRIRWDCGRGSESFHVAIRNSDSSREFDVSRSLLLIDVPRDCPQSCSISVTDQLYRPVVDERLTVRRSGQVPGGSHYSPLSPAGGALDGARLVSGQGSWRLLGASLLWKSACEIPAAAIAANLAYGIADPEAFCDQSAAPSPPRAGERE